MSLMLPPTLDCIIETVSRRIPPVTAIGSGSGKVSGTRGVGGVRGKDNGFGEALGNGLSLQRAAGQRRHGVRDGSV